MPVTKTVISMPSAQLKDMRELAKKENLTLSELIRNAYRGYRYRRTLKDLNESGRTKAAELGITEAEVIPLIHQFRQERRAKKSKHPGE
jgi:hypothetical protein